MADYILLLITAAGTAVPLTGAATPTAPIPVPPAMQRRVYADVADCERAAASITLAPGLRLVCVPQEAARLLDAAPF